MNVYDSVHIHVHVHEVCIYMYIKCEWMIIALVQYMHIILCMYRYIVCT